MPEKKNDYPRVTTPLSGVISLITGFWARQDEVLKALKLSLHQMRCICAKVPAGVVVIETGGSLSHLLKKSIAQVGTWPQHVFSVFLRDGLKSDNKHGRPFRETWSR